MSTIPHPQPATPLRGLTYRAQLILGSCALVLLAGVVIFLVTARSNRTTTTALVHSLFREVSGHAVSQTTDFISRAAPVAASLERMASRGLATDDLDRLAPQLLAFLEGNPGMTWVLYGQESGEYVGAARMNDGSLHIERTRHINGHTQLTESVVQPDGSWKPIRIDDKSTYDPRTRPFYTLAKSKRTLAWTAPYMFFSHGVPGISCVVPTFTDSGEFKGVFSVDFDLNALSEFVAGLSVAEHSSIFLFTTNGTLLAHPNQKDARATGINGQGTLPTLADAKDPLVDALRNHLGNDTLKNSPVGDFRFFEFNHDGVNYLASTTTFSVGNEQSWVVGAIAPESDFLAGVWRTRYIALGTAIAALALAAIIAVLFARRISRPVEALIAFMERVGAGDLEAKADFKGGREFRALSAALNRMIVDLRERLHLRNSLQVAMDVQKSLLPANDPITPLLDVAGRSTYCDETGGDYYDFIDVSSVTPSSLLIAVGDVMGHGIPSALVMATARAALRTSALIDHRLADLLVRTNNVLAADNRHNRFMTLLLMMIDAEKRIVCWASAGHDPTIVFDPATGNFIELEGADFPLGITAPAEFREFTSDPLPERAILVIGTDGIWEMRSEQGKMYGKSRLRDLVRQRAHEPATQIAAALEADLASFRGSASSLDDVTFVVIKFVS